jgi:hypothetical protein
MKGRACESGVDEDGGGEHPYYYRRLSAGSGLTPALGLSKITGEAEECE